MSTGQVQDLLQLLKAIADPQRLTMVRWMSDREHTVGEMAELLELTEPTVSHHISRLHGVGLLRLRMAGNQRFYSVNENRLAQFKAYVGEIEAPVAEPEKQTADNSWIDALDWDDADKKILRDHMVGTRLKQIPAKDKKWNVILRWLATRFESGVKYTEKEVNAILNPIHEDYAQMRRDLIGFGYMQREGAGGRYWLKPAAD